MFTRDREETRLEVYHRTNELTRNLVDAEKAYRDAGESCFCHAVTSPISEQLMRDHMSVETTQSDHQFPLLWSSAILRT